MTLRGRRVVGWPDFLELAVSGWILVSPFVLGFFHEADAASTAIFLGAVALMFSVLGLATQKMGDEMGNVVTALVLIVSPWAFTYSHVTVAVINALASGIVLIVLPTLALFEERADMCRMQEAKAARSRRADD